MASLLNGLDDCLNIQGLDGTEVDDLGLNAVLLLKLLGGSQRLADAAGEGDDGEVLAGALDLSLAELQIPLENMAAQTVGDSYRNNEVIALSLLAHGERQTVQQPGRI